MQGKIALITGSGRGIGAATARLLASRGCRVVVTSRTQSDVSRVVSQIEEETGSKDRVFGIVSDVENLDSIDGLFTAVEKKWGAVEVLVNNAGVGFQTDFLEIDAKTYQQIQDINVRGSFFCAQRMMKALKAIQANGCIVNISSLGGIRSTDKFPGMAPYVISKFAVVGLTEALAVEGKPLGIRVNAIAPGAVDTEMLRKAAPHLKTNTKAADIAKVIVSLCDENMSGAVTGTTVEIFSNA